MMLMSKINSTYRVIISLVARWVDQGLTPAWLVLPRAAAQYV